MTRSRTRSPADSAAASAELETRGQKLLAAKEFAEAEQVFTDALKVASTPPNAVSAYQGIAMALAGQRRLEDAAQALLKAREFDQKNAEVYQQLGEIAEMRGRPKEAVSLYSSAIALDPGETLPLARLRLGVLLAPGRQSSGSDIDASEGPPKKPRNEKSWVARVSEIRPRERQPHAGQQFGAHISTFEAILYDMRTNTVGDHVTVQLAGRMLNGSDPQRGDWIEIENKRAALKGGNLYTSTVHNLSRGGTLKVPWGYGDFWRRQLG
jgi:tetratricopeptide (TPR) repeat protein